MTDHCFSCFSSFFYFLGRRLHITVLANECFDKWYRPIWLREQPMKKSDRNSQKREEGRHLETEWTQSSPLEMDWVTLCLKNWKPFLGRILVSRDLSILWEWGSCQRSKGVVSKAEIQNLIIGLGGRRYKGGRLQSQVLHWLFISISHKLRQIEVSVAFW